MSDLPRQPPRDHPVGAAGTVAPGAWRRFTSQPRSFQIAMAATLLLPAALFYARAVADALLSIVAVLFLANRWLLRDRSWLRSPHIRLSLIFWVWLVLCTLVAGTWHAAGEAVAAIRLFLFAAALEFWVLADSRQRRLLGYVVLAAACWLVVETWQQYVFGTDMVGNHRWGSGVLTGPFLRARAGATLQTLYFVAFLPGAMYLLAQSGMARRLAGALVLIGTVLTMAVIGQRMPMLLVIFGLCLTGLLVRRFRWPIAVTLIVLAAAVAAARVLSPVTYETLVVVFLRRMEHFWSTPYALLYQRAVVMVQAHPWLGLGFDGFRDNCNDPRYFKPVAWLPITDIGDSAGCNIHPHNYWLQIATSTGLPGVALFAALCTVWLARIGRGTLAGARPIQLALFVTLCTALWPVASTTALFTVPNAGWLFLLIGWGLAEQNHGRAQAGFDDDGGRRRDAGFTAPFKGC
ncbi:MAG TPA: O-antigen ligase family protein [Acetobacteraceae bacterium]|nr:O-antigen ligase family protein [Acetobacteraceae bacterium]